MNIGLLCPFVTVMSEEKRFDMTNFMTLKETSEKWGIGSRRINTLCVEGRIPGAQKLGNMWIIPVDA